jgi:hypothetical protein
MIRNSIIVRNPEQAEHIKRMVVKWESTGFPSRVTKHELDPNSTSSIKMGVVIQGYPIARKQFREIKQRM